MKHKEAWLKFKNCGLLWLVNGLLHHMGYVIGFEYEDDELVGVYPVQSKYTGFTEQVERNGRLDLGEHLERIGSMAGKTGDEKELRNS